jgi:hypothetical protein
MSRTYFAQQSKILISKSEIRNNTPKAYAGAYQMTKIRMSKKEKDIPVVEVLDLGNLKLRFV